MTSISEIRDGFAAQLSAISQLQASSYVLSNPTLPYAQVTPIEIDYDQTFQRGRDLWKFRITVLVGTPTDIGAQKQLDRFCDPFGPESVKEIVEQDPTLGGVVTDLIVRSCTGWQLFERSGQPPALGASWEVDAWLDKP